ncbi:hypothetical protein GCM10010840_11770 [Deinococcus aerolatus]|uniref:SIR2-like domain-containing protein n=1 Tax=Deinococcus aerolatus TaxID=522487 RepID=A0ABQ2G551_9DEIO|nr:SIR2 family protein [Deinococcus aerolatus]GGL75297.1 hypothetical protein GCM10010840_11770 [Deinococcus aerolatus]
MDPDAYRSQLTSMLTRAGGLPYLFVGSGMSIRYLGLESWSGLLQKFASESSNVLDYYKVRTQLKDDDEQILSMPMTGTLVASDFTDVWFRSPKYEAQREKYLGRAGFREAPIKIAISEYMSEKTLDESSLSDDLATEINFLKSARARGIITTNYDTLMEQVFPNFTPYVGQNDLITSQLTLVRDIYKIHGSIEDPSSIVLTYEDYKKFLGINKYLVAKIMTIFVENPIIFFGYSIGDYNVQAILSDIMKIAKDRDFITEKIRDKIFIFEWDESLTAPEISKTYKNILDVQLPVNIVRVPNYIDTFQVLSELPEIIPQAVLKYVLQNLYEIKSQASGNDPERKIVLLDQESYSEDSIDNLEIVIGFGIKEKISINKRGYSGLEIRDALHDIIDDSLIEQGYKPEEILSEFIDDRFDSLTYVPICKYLHLSGRFEKPNPFEGIEGVRKIYNRITREQGYSRYYTSAATARKEKMRLYPTFSSFIAMPYWIVNLRTI